VYIFPAKNEHEIGSKFSYGHPESLQGPASRNAAARGGGSLPTRRNNMQKKLHNFEQVKDVLDYGIELHAQLRTLYSDLGEQSDQARVKMVLDYLSRHERNRAEALRRFEQPPHANSLDVWLQYAPSLEIEQMLKDCAIRPDMSVDDVVKISLRFDNALIEIYKEAAREAEDTNARAIFENLVEMEEKEKQRFIRDVEWMDDM
jgi:hypothetical protein